MDSPSELELFLQEQSTVGEAAAEGTFTLAREQALKKLANFQLPFANAWILKFVQTAVATQSGRPIKIALKTRECRICFSFEGVELSEVEEAFYTPEPSKKKALEHLQNGLWSVALKEQWPFQLSVPGWEESLVWDGEHLTRLPANSYDCAVLTVAFVKKDQGVLNWVKKVSTSGIRNAELLTTLKNRCYTCPVPLTVDGRRLDSLYHCPTHGPTTEDHPIALGFAQHPELVKMTVPPGTFEKKPVAKNVQSFWTLETSHPTDYAFSKLSTSSLKRVEHSEVCSAPFLLTIHRRFSTSLTNKGWKDRDEASRLYWINDGVIVDEEKLLERNNMSLAVFASAEKLPTDLTSFHLALTVKKRMRTKAVRLAVADSLDNLQGLNTTLEQTVRSGKLKSRVLAGGLLLLGTATAWAAPPFGLTALGVGGVMVANAGKTQEKQAEVVNAAIRDIQERLRR